ncbi:MAG: alginate lyase family protein [Candidatus Humimicrobiaceae bacterium]
MSSFSDLFINNSKFISEKVSEEYKINLIKKADEFCNHEFQLLGSEKVKVNYNLEPAGFEEYEFVQKNNPGQDLTGKIKDRIRDLYGANKDFDNIFYFSYEPVDWSVDFKSGYRWEDRQWHKNIKFGNVLGADVKVPWELSRFYHLINLGQAYLVTKDEKYTKEFIHEIIDWEIANKPYFGVNWTCPMEVSIRAANLILGMSFFIKSGYVNEKFFNEFSKIIYLHSFYICNNLKRDDVIFRGNHYLSDIAVLLYCGIFFNGTDLGEKYLKFSTKSLKREIVNQIYKDGSDFEASSFYHRLVLELFIFPVYLLLKFQNTQLKNDFSEHIKEILGESCFNSFYKMFEVVLHLSDIKGDMVQIGDNDSGRLHIFGNNNSLDVSYLLTTGAVLFNDCKFKIKEFGFRNQMLWLFGEEGFDIWNKLEPAEYKSIGSRSFKDAGWYIIKDKSFQCIISAGQNGQNNFGGHSHNDKLSFSVNFKDKNVFVDCGTYVYTSSPYLRNQFRSSSYHNTVVVDNEEQNRFIDKSLFAIENDSRVRIKNWENNDTYDLLDAEHYGYQRLNGKVIHRRKLLYIKSEECLLIKDLLTGEGIHKCDFNLHLGENIKIDYDLNDLSVNIKINDSENLKLVSLEKDSLKLEIKDGWFSKSYGVKNPIKVLNYSKEMKLPAGFFFLLADKNKNINGEIISCFKNLL